MFFIVTAIVLPADALFPAPTVNFVSASTPVLLWSLLAR
jgi:hypothetical protein